MTTQAQVQANGRNAQLSTGPRTPAGKAIVAGNALRNGLRTEAMTAAARAENGVYSVAKRWRNGAYSVGKTGLIGRKRLRSRQPPPGCLRGQGRP
jgi:hypothetical protein